LQPYKDEGFERQRHSQFPQIEPLHASEISLPPKIPQILDPFVGAEGYAVPPCALAYRRKWDKPGRTEEKGLIFHCHIDRSVQSPRRRHFEISIQAFQGDEGISKKKFLDHIAKKVTCQGVVFPQK